MPSPHGPIPGVRSPHRLSATPAVEPQAPPMVGEQSRDVLADVLGLGTDELDALIKDGVIG